MNEMQKDSKCMHLKGKGSPKDFTSTERLAVSLSASPAALACDLAISSLTTNHRSF